MQLGFLVLHRGTWWLPLSELISVRDLVPIDNAKYPAGPGDGTVQLFKRCAGGGVTLFTFAVCIVQRRFRFRRSARRNHWKTWAKREIGAG